MADTSRGSRASVRGYLDKLRVTTATWSCAEHTDLSPGTPGDILIHHAVRAPKGVTHRKSKTGTAATRAAARSLRLATRRKLRLIQRSRRQRLLLAQTLTARASKRGRRRGSHGRASPVKATQAGRQEASTAAHSAQQYQLPCAPPRPVHRTMGPRQLPDGCATACRALGAKRRLLLCRPRAAAWELLAHATPVPPPPEIHVFRQARQLAPHRKRVADKQRRGAATPGRAATLERTPLFSPHTGPAGRQKRTHIHISIATAN